MKRTRYRPLDASCWSGIHAFQAYAGLLDLLNQNSTLIKLFVDLPNESRNDRLQAVGIFFRRYTKHLVVDLTLSLNAALSLDVKGGTLRPCLFLSVISLHNTRALRGLGSLTPKCSHSETPVALHPLPCISECCLP